MKSRFTFVVILLFMILCSGCSDYSSDSKTTSHHKKDHKSNSQQVFDLSKIKTFNFIGGEIPQIDLSGPVPDWTWNDPHVLKIDTEYWMYASATNHFDYPVRLYRLVSLDGINWRFDFPVQILADAVPGDWDAGGMETPAVVFFNGQYHLFYTGYQYEVDDPRYLANSPYDFRIGHAVSFDGKIFTRSTINPIFLMPSGVDANPENDWYAFVIAEPGPIVYNGVLYLYFTAVGVDAELGTSLQVIGLIATTDGINWSNPQLVLKPDQSVYPRNQDWVGYSTPNAIVLGNVMHLFFDVAHQPGGGAWLQLRLHHAYSLNGKTGWIQDTSAIRMAGDLNWAINEIRSPDALLDGTVLRLYFAGHELDGINPEHFAIGMMTSTLTP